MDYEAMAAAGTGLGSGGFIVYDTSHCIVRVAAELCRFLAVESCGQCNACKLGTGLISDVLHRLDDGHGDGVELEQLAYWAEHVTDLARCGLPTGAQVIVASLLTDFEDELVDHVGRRCWSDRQEHVPKIVHLGLDEPSVGYDTTHQRKRADWTYAPAEKEPETRGHDDIHHR